jgi:hypothetical protein
VTLFLALAVLALDGGLVEDFEGAVLEGWERVSSDSHPPYNSAELVRDPQAARSGIQFLRMRTQGGATALRRQAWPVDSALPYRLTVQARLSGTRSNSAAVTLIWLNGDGRQVAESRSTPLSRPGGWTEIALDIARVPAGAASVSPRLDFDGDDVRGECDFDRLVLAPVERLDIRPAGRPFAVFTPEEYPRFSVSLAGAGAGAHGITLTMQGSDGTQVRRTAVLTAPADQSVDLDFPRLGPGAHQLVATLDGREDPRSLTVLVPNPWISPRDGAPPADEILALAGLSTALRDPAAANDSLEVVLRRRIADPGSTPTLGRLFLDAEGRPTAALLALRAANDVLANAVPLPDPGLFPPNVHIAAFRKGDSAALALWSETGELEMPVALNEGAKLYPPLGAIRVLRPGERLRLGALPVFITGIDPLLLELRLNLAGPDLPLQLGPSARTLRLRNPSRTQALRDVRVRLEELPAGWRVTPREISAATLAGDADLSEELQFVLPPSEAERIQELRFEVRFVRNGQERVIRLSRAVRVTSPLGIETAVVDGPKPGSKKLTVRITNASDRAMTLAIRARLPQLPEQIELLRNLAPGATSSPFEYVVKDVPLLDPTRLAAEIDVQESVGARAGARKVILLR